MRVPGRGVMRRRSGRDVAVASGRGFGRPAGAGREDVPVLEGEVHVAPFTLGHRGREVAGPAGIWDLSAAEGATDDEADLLRGGPLAGLRLDLEPEPADDRQRFPGPGGDQMADLVVRHEGLLPAPAPRHPRRRAPTPRSARTGREHEAVRGVSMMKTEEAAGCRP